MAFRSRQQVRHPDIDRAGIVYFPRFYDFFHRALEDFFHTEAGVDWWDLADRLGVAFPLVHIETDFARPLQHGDMVTLQLSTAKLGAHSVVLRFEVFRPDEEKPASVSSLVLCCIGLPGWKKAPIPEKLRAAFERHRAG
ncbi:MAG TPA: thioesterase family protein [Anaeromyxobacter sp.]|nr:thioesterase family protein [Anaeromyxobacter sp.]